MGHFRERPGSHVAKLAFELLEVGWVQAAQPDTRSSEVPEARSAELEQAILARDRDDFLARAAAMTVYAARALVSADPKWGTYVWDVVDELLEDINAPTTSPVSLVSSRRAIPIGKVADIREWACARDLRSVVRDLRPTVRSTTRSIARAVSKIGVPRPVLPLPDGLDERELEHSKMSDHRFTPNR
jgi:hypothetical protein